MNKKGFSLIELLIVIVIIGIIAVIAIPNLLEAKKAAQMAAAQQILRTITSAQISYSTKNTTRAFGTFAQLVAAGNLDGRFSGTDPIDGFVFTGAGSVGGFAATAIPSDASLPSYTVDQSGVIKYVNGTPVN